jgi:putative redox protein
MRAKILAIAERCPVDLSLVRGSEIETQFEEVDQAPGPIMT